MFKENKTYSGKFADFQRIVIEDIPDMQAKTFIKALEGVSGVLSAIGPGAPIAAYIFGKDGKGAQLAVIFNEADTDPPESDEVSVSKTIGSKINFTEYTSISSGSLADLNLIFNKAINDLKDMEHATVLDITLSSIVGDDMQFILKFGIYYSELPLA